MNNGLTSSIDPVRAESISRKVVTAYDVLDDLAEAVRQFRGFCKLIYRTAKRLGPKATARDVIEESHLNPHGESAR